VGWHLDGMEWAEYLRLPLVDRMLLHEELSDIIERTDGEPRPKNFRK